MKNEKKKVIPIPNGTERINVYSYASVDDRGADYPNGDASFMVDELPDVPEIEMTKAQKAVFDQAKQMLETNELAKVVGDEFGGWSLLDEVSGRIWGHDEGTATNVQVEKTMLAWLFPQMIKVVDE